MARRKVGGYMAPNKYDRLRNCVVYHRYNVDKICAELNIDRKTLYNRAKVARENGVGLVMLPGEPEGYFRPQKRRRASSNDYVNIDIE